MKNFARRFVAAVVATVYASTNVAFAHVPETSVWAGRRRSPVVADARMSLPPHPALSALLPKPSFNSSLVSPLPSSWSSLIEAVPAAEGRFEPAVLTPAKPDGRLVIHIQDVHENAEAQKNLSSAVSALLATGRVPLVALEGAFAPIRLSPFRRALSAGVVRGVADRLLADSEISGPIHGILTAHGPVPNVIGVDDHRTYHENVSAYLRSRDVLNSQKAQLAHEKFQLAGEKANQFSAALRDFDTAVDDYRSGRTQIGLYLAQVKKAAPSTVSTVEISSFLNALALEKRLDIARVDAERRHYLTALAEQVPSAALERLLRQLTSRPAQSALYQGLIAFGTAHGISISAYPALQNHAAYLLASERVHPDALFKEMSSVEDACYRRLSLGRADDALIARGTQLWLRGKLLEFSLSTREWQRYGDRAEASPFADFYRAAEKRDGAISSNVLRAMEKSSARVSVLVTGGFHSDGVARALADQGITTLNFIPRVTAVDTKKGIGLSQRFCSGKNAPRQTLQRRSPLPVTQSGREGNIGTGAHRDRRQRIGDGRKSCRR